MTANISMIGGVSEMAFVGETPWHGLGQRLSRGASLETWQEQAGMAWKIQRSKVRFAIQKGDDSGVVPETSLLEWPDRHVLFRSDTKQPLSVVSDGYKIVQPAKVLEFFHHVAEENRIELETAGCLNGGRVYWALAKLGPEFVLAGTDRIKSYAMLVSSCDSSVATTAKYTDIRVVCQNTVRLALGDGNKAIKVKHSTNFDATKVRIDMGLAVERFEEVKTNATRLANRRLTRQAALEVLIKSIGDEEAFMVARAKDGVSVALSAQPNHRQMGEILALFDGKARGSQSLTAQGTAWGLVNAATEFYDHFAGRSDDSRLTSAWFGVNDGRKQAILTNALALAD